MNGHGVADKIGAPSISSEERLVSKDKELRYMM